MFIILSCSDTGVGLFSIPMMSLELFTCDLEAGRMLFLLLEFLIPFPLTFSTILIMIIALDRVFIITRARVYKKYITIKVLYCIIIICLLLNFVILTLYVMEITMELSSFKVVHILLLSGELCFIFIIIMAYIYLYIFILLCSVKITEDS